MSGIFSWSPFSRSSSDSPETIELRHGKRTYHFSFQPNTLSTVPVSQLKELARDKGKLGNDVDIKFFFQGKRLDDKAELGKYNIKDGSRILMTSSKKIERPISETTTATSSKSNSNPPSATVTPVPPKVVASQSPLDRIAAMRQSIKNTYGPQVTTFIKNPPGTRKERVETKARLSELLLQQLLKFDDVHIDPDDYASKEARLERKAAVKWVQGLMDDVDAVDVDI